MAELSTNGNQRLAVAGHGESAAVKELWKFVGRHRWWVLGTPAFMLLAALVFVSIAVPKYEGSTLLRIDKRRNIGPQIDALQELSSVNEIQSDMLELRSRTLAEDVVDELDLHVQVSAPQRVTRASLFTQLEAQRDASEAEYTLTRIRPDRFRIVGEGISAKEVTVGLPFTLPGATATLSEDAAHHEVIALRVQPFQVAVAALQHGLIVARPDREAGMVQIDYQTSDRALAREVPNAVARGFVERRQMVQTSQARGTAAFLEDQIAALNKQLRDQESRIRTFRERESVVSPEAEAEAQVQRLADFQARRDVLDAEREALQRMLHDLESKEPGGATVRSLVGFPTLVNHEGATSQMLASLNELESQRAELLTRRTEEDPDVVALTGRIDELEREIGMITTRYLQGLSSQIAAYDGALTRFADQLRNIPAKEIQLARMTRQTKVDEELYTTLQEQLKEAQILAAVRDPSVRVVDPAILPLRPVSPNKPLSLFLALMIGLALGMAVGFLREHLDTTIHTREELQTEAGLVPILGLIPRIEEAAATNGGARRIVWRPRRQVAVDLPAALRSRLVAGKNPRGSASEAYRSLRTNIVFSRPEKPPKALVFTSPAPGDGKSTSASNLAITLAQQQLRVILIDADMRRGLMHQAFGTAERPGLSDYLLGGPSLEDVIRNVTLENDVSFSFIPTGTLPPNPAELIASTRMQALLEHLDGEYDAVIFDAPPLNVVTDAAVLGARADGVILVVRAGVTERAALRYSLEQLESVHARVLGCMLNDVNVAREAYYGPAVAGEYYS